jgi:hypothetical protein
MVEIENALHTESSHAGMYINHSISVQNSVKTHLISYPLGSGEFSPLIKEL